MFLPAKRGAQQPRRRRGLGHDFATAVDLRQLAEDVAAWRTVSEQNIGLDNAGAWWVVQGAGVRADDNDVLQGGAKSFERVHRVVVEEEEGAVVGEGAHRW
jgi:hypothetical protein